MGTLFSAPKPTAPPPLPPLPTDSDSDAQERKRRLDALQRKRRGRNGLITTSARGLLNKTGASSTGKTLLGE